MQISTDIPLQNNAVNTKHASPASQRCCEVPSGRRYLLTGDDCFDDLRLLFIAHCGSAGQAQATREQSLRNPIGNMSAIGEGGLQVHRFPNRTSFDFLSFQRQPHVIMGSSECCGINQNRGQPASRPKPVRFRHHGDLRQTSQFIPIAIENLTTPIHAVYQYVQLFPADRRQQVAHAIVVANFIVFIVRSRFSCLSCQMPRSIGPDFPIADQHATAAGGNKFVAIEGKTGHVAERAGRP